MLINLNKELRDEAFRKWKQDLIAREPARAAEISTDYGMTINQVRTAVQQLRGPNALPASRRWIVAPKPESSLGLDRETYDQIMHFIRREIEIEIHERWRNQADRNEDYNYE